MKIAKFVLPVIAAGLASSTAFGGVVINQIDQAVVAGYQANEIVWEGGADWTSSALVVDLTSGTAYQDAFGGDAPYTPALLVPFPSVEFDTYVGIVNGVGNGIAGGAGDLGGGPLSLNANQISVSWFNTGTDDTAAVRIGMITLSTDAAGTWKLLSGGVITEGTVEGGALVPEPASLALLGLGGLAALRRR